MARKSRKAADIETDANVISSRHKMFQAALYVRMSVENEAKREADSIGIQLQMLKDFASECDDLVTCDVYCDDDITGTDFIRPEFSRMMNDIRSGKINCVIVKDLSRLGRNLVEMGEYVERVFPFFGVRFIAINDNCDTLKRPIGLSEQVKNLANEMYAKDISKKICSTMKNMQTQGKFVSGRPAYGYIRDENDKYHLVPDPETAPIVQRIFHMFLNGETIHGITMQLNRENIPSPGYIKYLRGEVKADKFKKSLWNFSGTRRMLCNDIYRGWLVLGKLRSDFYSGGSKSKQIPREDWVIIKDAHEPIMTETVFVAAQERLEQYKEKQPVSKNYDCKSRRDNLLRGKLQCGSCGKSMIFRKKKRHDGSYQYWYACPIHDSYDSTYCGTKSIKQETLEGTLLQILQNQINLYKDTCKTIASLNQKSRSQTRYKIYHEQINKLRGQIENCIQYKGSLYQDFAEGVITERDFMEMSQQYAKEADELQIFLSELERDVLRYTPDFTGAPKWQKVIDEFSCCEELTRPMIEAFIEKVIIQNEGYIEVMFSFRNDLEQILAMAASREREVEQYAG